MDPLLKKCDYCGFMPNTVAHHERSEPLENRIAELEAALVERDTALEGAANVQHRLEAELAEAKKLQNRLADSVARAEDAWKDERAKAVKAEAEVERLSLLSQKPRENDVEWNSDEMYWDGYRWWPNKAAARKERDQSLSARKATPETNYHANGKECQEPYCDQFHFAARKERAP